MLRLGEHTLAPPFFLAPMAGLTDLPFRQLCRQLGAGLAVGEMTASDPSLWDSQKSSTRWVCQGEMGLKVVQLVGSDPGFMAAAARYAQDMGADVVDLNLGCPAKKVLKKACGSALMREPELVQAIVREVRQRISIPLTLKMRTGWDEDHKNAVELALMVQDEGVQMITVHGRTRAQGFKGQAEYETIYRVKQALNIPVVANGDIDSVAKAHEVLDRTGADAVMIGRGALGRPWLFAELAASWKGQSFCASEAQKRQWLLEHAKKHFTFYSGEKAVRLFRKHITYYLCHEPEKKEQLLTLTQPQEVLEGLAAFATEHQ